ncbi:MAG TPA: OmpH family outer membrane protein [Spirochaetota bacterium]|nr:OmpH family outer membrane protein [Spirochaetota bacterium]HRX46437.1 OmpH family outer membrane protein [Spirochaetota bacterium]
MKRLSLISLLLFLCSCSSFRTGNTDEYVIRYVDLPRVYAFAVKHKGVASPEVRVGSQDDVIKKRLYEQIKTAISNVARRHNADFILNTGEAVLYSRSSYDVTDDVIREYKKLSDISSPEAK